MRYFLVAITALAAGFLLAADAPKENAEKKLRELHKDRIATLQQITDLYKAQIANGFVTREDIMQAKLQLLKAELDAANTDEERITIQSMIVEMMIEFEEMTAQVVMHSHVDRTVYLKAKAERLKAEIELERLKARNI
jgi:C-terminal processing protease CtpA/Prc